MSGATVDLAAVDGAGRGDGGVTHGAALVAFTEAVMGNDEARLASERQRLLGLLSPEAFVDVCAVIGMFNVVDRVADAIGIPLDPPLATMSAAVRAELDLGRFASAANSRHVLGE
jgi:alkylhydroperoxidase family enzyme